MIPHNSPTLGEAEKQAAARVLGNGWIAQGREVAAFEDEVCAYLGVGSGHAVAVSSGTAALFLALQEMGARGKRVAIPVYSCAAVSNAVFMAGAEPSSIDTAKENPNIDMKQAGDGRADLVVAAHMFGFASRVALHGTAFPLIEDCAQAFGARLNGRPVGLNGHAGVFSFYATKMITSGGQGGMFISRDESLVRAVRDYREFDGRRDRVPRFNLQMTDLQAAIGRAQLSQIEYFLERRKRIYGIYQAAGLPLWPSEAEEDSEPCRYRAVLRVANPSELIARLEREGIRAIVPIEVWELLADADGYPHAEFLARNTVSLPMFPSLSDEQVRHVAAAVRLGLAK